MWSNRKPYYDLDKSFKEFMDEPVRFLAESNTMESQFEKPYNEDDYWTMHLRIPWPAAIGGAKLRGCLWTRDIEEGDEVVRTLELGGFGVQELSLVLRDGVTNQICGDCTNITECYDYDWFGDVEVGYFTAKFKSSGKKTTLTVQGTNINRGCVGTNECTGRVILADCEGKNSLDFEINFQSTFCRDQGYPPGSGCTKHESIPCPQTGCDDAIPVAWGDNSETMAKGSTIIIAVTPGVAPYQWSVSGTGFSLAKAKTYGLSNLLIASGIACGPATVVVTDACGSSVTGYVRCTTGVWTLIDLCGNAAAQGYGMATTTLISGMYKDDATWCFTKDYGYGDGDCAMEPIGFTCYQYGCNDPPDCPTSLAVPSEAAGGRNKLCCLVRTRRYEWTCS